MSEVVQVAHSRKPSQSPSAERRWSIEYQINARELLRIELHWKGTRIIVDVRRWLRQPDGSAQPAKKGFAVAIHHLPAVKALIEAALLEADAIATSAIEATERSQTATPRRSVSGDAS